MAAPGRVIHGVRRHGALRGVVPPRAPYFGGRVFLLVDGRSGSASEPLAHLLKTTGLATLVGERTAGGMLSAPPHPVGDGWMMIFPEADYFAADRTRLEGNGVRPHVAVASDRALATVAERIRAEQPYAGALLLGAAHQEANRLAEAERWFGEAVRLAPDSMAPLRGLASVHAAGKRWDAAFAALDRLLAREPGDASALYNTGRVAALSGLRLESGERALRAYLARPHRADLPSHAAAHWRLGMILEARGDFAGARREYGSALRLEPQHADAQAALRALNDRAP
jgi:tetratricopeptide (TPR) repeat protein